MANIGLVLSGGGVKGLAHIGVIKYLEEIGLNITHVSGTSSGALVGMMYAAGLKADDILKYFMKTSLFSVKNFSYGKPGFLDLLKYEEELKNIFKVERFDELDKKFYVNATNLFTGEEKVFWQGKFIRPVLASATFPLVFSPVEIGGEWYADGGIVNNFPVENCPPEVDHIVGVNLNNVLKIGPEELSNSFDVIERSFNIMMGHQVNKKIDSCSVILHPPELSTIGVFEMKKRKEAYKIGYEAAKNRTADLMALSFK